MMSPTKNINAEKGYMLDGKQMECILNTDADNKNHLCLQCLKENVKVAGCGYMFVGTQMECIRHNYKTHHPSARSFTKNT